VGLLWAARNKILVAVERSLAVLVEDGEMIPPALLALRRLAWIELQLGRIPQVLQAMTLAQFAALHLKLSEDRMAAHVEEVRAQEVVLAIHLLNIPFATLPAASRLPDALERLGLTNARLALLFVLGQEKAIRDEGHFFARKGLEEMQALFERLHGQPAAKDIPPHPVLVTGATSLLKSTILGSEIVVETPNDPTSFGIAESLLGALEAFLATSNEANLLPHRERTTIVIRASDQVMGVPQIHFPEYDGARVDITHPVDLAFPTAEDVHNFSEWLRDSVIAIVSRLFMIRDPEAWMAKIAGEERAFSRALLLGDALTLDRNVFGDRPDFRLEDWLKEEDKTYTVLRSRPWRCADRVEAHASANPDELPKFGVGPPPRDLLNKSELKHTERRVLSPIDIGLWDRARWRGTLFVTVEGNAGPPLLGIGFEDGQVGEAIFRAWRDRWGEEDVDDALRVAIITGVSKRHPAHYAVTIGPNLNLIRNLPGNTATTVSRINRMEPSSSANLDRFIDAYRQVGGYLLIPAQIGSSFSLPPKLYLAKRQLHIRPAWEISENDPDMMAMQEDDDPIIPATVLDPPVRKALERLKSLRSTVGDRP
jgi:hypothetical protein